MNICLVTAFPPSHDALNEYGFHIARELKAVPGLKLTILGDEYSCGEPELDGFEVVRCWKFDALGNPARLLKNIRKIQPDVVWFNLGFASFGGKPLPAFVGIITPAATRLSGFYTHVTLHQLMETVDLKDAKIRFPLLYKAAGFAATQLVLFANSVSVLLPAYRTLIREKYRRGSVYVRRHGILSGRPEYPQFSKRGNPVHRILAFGKWGTYKRLEPMLEVFENVTRRVRNVELVIAGADHPKAAGYLKSVEEKCKGHSNIRFAGYVPEDQVRDLFQSVTVAVMPYTSSAGSSGVAHLACAYGVPMIASDIPDFRQLKEEEGIAIDLYQTGNLQDLTEKLVSLLESPERQFEMATQTFSAAMRMSMPEVIRQYLRTFDLQCQLGFLSSVSRLRKVPRWLPLRDRLLRAATRRRLHRLLTTPPTASFLDTQHDRSGAVLGPGISVNGNAEALGGMLERGTAGGGNSSTAGHQQEYHSDQPGGAECTTHALSHPVPSAGDGDGCYPQTGEPESIFGVLSLLPISGTPRSRNGSSGNGHRGDRG